MWVVVKLFRFCIAFQKKVITGRLRNCIYFSYSITAYILNTKVAMSVISRYQTAGQRKWGVVELV